MNLLYAILLGIIEGLTEYIPVSSTAHLLIAQRLLNLPSDQGMFAFIVLVQLGPLLALLLYFRHDYWDLIRALFARPFHGPANSMAWFVIIATIPALLAGFLLHDFVQSLFQNPLQEAAIRLMTAAILLALGEWLGKKTRLLDSMVWLDSLVVGLFQILVVIPGASRSGSAISGGMLRNFDRPSATRFAFLMAAPVMFAAGGYEALSIYKLHILGTILPGLVVGLITATIVGWLSIGWLLRYVSKHSLYQFAAYCAIVAALCIIFLFV